MIRTLFVLLILVGCKEAEKANVSEKQAFEPKEITTATAQDLENLVKPEEGKIKVINFWATWCAPCVEELPAFVNVYENAGENLEMVLVSLDDPAKGIAPVEKFVKENKISPQVTLLDAPDASIWIPMVDPHWDGAIPVTLMVTPEKRRFYARSFTESELEDAIEKLR